MSKVYTTWGSVCGSCGHRHRTPEAARRCLARHARGCASQGGYSDRAVYVLDRDDRFDPVTHPPGEIFREYEEYEDYHYPEED